MLVEDVRLTASEADDAPHVLVLRAAQRALLLHGLSADARLALTCALAAERDTLAYLPTACGFTDTFARALVAALWRRFGAHGGCSTPLAAAYFRGWGGAAGEALFVALWRTFARLLSPHALDGDAQAVTADVFVDILAPTSASDVLLRHLLLVPWHRLADGALAAWARTPRPGARDFEKLLHCGEAAVRELRRGRRWVLPLLLGVDGGDLGADLFGPASVAWHEQQGAAPQHDALVHLTADALLQALGPHADLRMAQRLAMRGELEGVAAVLALLPRGTMLASLARVDNTYASLLLLPPALAAGNAVQLAEVLLSDGVSVTELCRSLLNVGLRSPSSARALHHALELLLFEANAVTLTPLGCDLLADGASSSFLASVVDAVECAAETRDSVVSEDILCGLVELVLRLQHCAPGTSGGRGGGFCGARHTRAPPELPSDVLPALCARLHFAAYLVHLHEANRAILLASDEADAERAEEATSSSLLDWHVRSRVSTLAAFEAYFAMCVRCRPQLLQALLEDMHGWQDTFFPQHSAASSLRQRFVSILLASPAFCNLYDGTPGGGGTAAAGGGGGGGSAGFVSRMVNGQLLRDPCHFHPDALRAMCLPTVVHRGLTISDATWLIPSFSDSAVSAAVAAVPAAAGAHVAHDGVSNAVAPDGAEGAASQPARRGASLLAALRLRARSMTELAAATVEDEGAVPEATAAESVSDTPPVGEDVMDAAPAPARSKIATFLARRRGGSSSATSFAEQAPGTEAAAADGDSDTGAPLSWFASFFARRRATSGGAATPASADDVTVADDATPAPNEDADVPTAADVTPETAARAAAAATAAVAEAPRDAAQFAQDAQLVFELVELGLYLRKSAGLDVDVCELFVNMNDAKNGAAGAELHKRSVLLILEDIRHRRDNNNVSDFFDPRKAAQPAMLDMRTINECACFARDALAMLASQPVSQLKLRGVFTYYVDRSQPAAWTGLFKGTATIAFFLKYLDRENFEQAFKAFREANEGADREPCDAALFSTLMSSVAETYTAPLFKLEAATLSDEAKVKELIDDIRASGVRSGKTVLGMLQRVTAGWMELSKKKFQVPMAPRNAQIISMLLCCEWVRRRMEKHPSVPEEQRAFITRVGTGEGKSLIIAMIAIYVVQILGKKVHVMEANEALLLRDVAEMREFYALFGLSVSANFGGFLRDEKADITYCCRRELNTYYRNNISNEPMRNTVLILDEVDQLIVDESPNTAYVTKDMERSPQLKQMFDVFRAGGKGNEFPNDAVKTKAWNAFVRGEKLRKPAASGDATDLGGKFARVETQDPATGEMRDVYVELDDKGKPMKGFYFMSCEYLNYYFNQVPPESKSFYFFQSSAHARLAARSALRALLMPRADARVAVQLPSRTQCRS